MCVTQPGSDKEEEVSKISDQLDSIIKVIYL